MVTAIECCHHDSCPGRRRSIALSIRAVTGNVLRVGPSVREWRGNNLHGRRSVLETYLKNDCLECIQSMGDYSRGRGLHQGLVHLNVLSVSIRRTGSTLLVSKWSSSLTPPQWKLDISTVVTESPNGSVSLKGFVLRPRDGYNGPSDFE